MICVSFRPSLTDCRISGRIAESPASPLRPADRTLLNAPPPPHSPSPPYLRVSVIIRRHPHSGPRLPVHGRQRRVGVRLRAGGGGGGDGERRRGRSEAGGGRARRGGGAGRRRLRGAREPAHRRPRRPTAQEQGGQAVRRVRRPRARLQLRRDLVRVVQGVLPPQRAQRPGRWQHRAREPSGEKIKK